MISVLLPSRGRPESLRRTVQTLRDLAAFPERVEVLVAADPDDPETLATAMDIDATVQVAVERWGYAELHRYYNALAEIANGEWLLLWNDDAFMTTTGWDEVLYGLRPDVLVADLASNHPSWLCCFPAVRRAAVDAVGGFSPHTPHCDTYWQEAGRKAGVIERVAVRVHHDRRDLTGGHDDQTYAESQAGYRSREFFGMKVQTAISSDADKLRALR